MDVEIYSKTNCVFCDKAKMRLANENPKIHMLDKDYTRDDFFEKFPEERQGRKNFKDKEIQNVKLLIYEKIIKKGDKIKADCIGNIEEKTSPKNITITVSYFKKHG